MNRKRGIFSEPDVAAKRVAFFHPKYQCTFSEFDRNGSGTIDMQELSDLLRAFQVDVEGLSYVGALFVRPCNPNTILWLASRFADSSSGVIAFPQFVELMEYLETLRSIFKQIDTDNSGAIDLSELTRAFTLSGFRLDACSPDAIQRIGKSYDFGETSTMTFDEFIQLRLEWDTYLSAWEAVVCPGMGTITPQQVLSVLEAIKVSTEPFASMVSQGSLQGFSPNCLDGLYYNTMFNPSRPFLQSTCEVLVRKFGFGLPFLTFEQFCMMMLFLTKQKRIFVNIDLDKSGTLDIHELDRFLRAGAICPFRAGYVLHTTRLYDQRADGCLHFDEFLQMMVALEDNSKFRSRCLFLASILVLTMLVLASWPALTTVLITALMILLGILVQLMYARSHWGELHNFVPRRLQTVGYRQRMILSTIVLSLVVAIVLYLQQPV